MQGDAMAIVNTIPNPVTTDLGANFSVVNWGTPVPSPRRTRRRRSSGITIWTTLEAEGSRGVHIDDEAAIEALTDMLIARRAAKTADAMATLS